MENILFGISITISSITLISALMLFVYIKRNKKPIKQVKKITVLKGKGTKAKQVAKPKKDKDKDWMWDYETNGLVEITPDVIAKWKFKIDQKTEDVIKKSKKAGK